MTLLVQFLVIFAALGSIDSWRDDRHGVAGEDERDEVVTVVSFVGNHVFAVKVLYQGFGLGYIMPLTTGQQQVQRIAQAVYQDVDLTAEPASTSTERLLGLSTVFWAAPAAQGWARTTVLSGITLSISASSLK